MEFRAHGELSARELGQVLLVDVVGPWNLELIQAYHAAIDPRAERLAERGPWALIVEIRGAALCPFDAIEAIRRGARQQAGQGRRTCTAYVIAPEVEGARLTAPLWRGIYDGVMPFEIFETREPALRWVRRLLGADD